MTNIAIGTRRNENLTYKTVKVNCKVLWSQLPKKNTVTTFHTNEYFVYFFHYEY